MSCGSSIWTAKTISSYFTTSVLSKRLKNVMLEHFHLDIVCLFPMKDGNNIILNCLSFLGKRNITIICEYFVNIYMIWQLIKYTFVHYFNILYERIRTSFRSTSDWRIGVAWTWWTFCELDNNVLLFFMAWLKWDDAKLKC